MLEQKFDHNHEAQKVFDAANAMADASNSAERRESAEAFDNLRAELCQLSPKELKATLDTVMQRSDDAWISRDKSGRVSSLNFRISDYGFIGMNLNCRKSR